MLVYTYVYQTAILISCYWWDFDMNENSISFLGSLDHWTLMLSLVSLNIRHLMAHTRSIGMCKIIILKILERRQFKELYDVNSPRSEILLLSVFATAKTVILMGLLLVRHLWENMSLAKKNLNGFFFYWLSYVLCIWILNLQKINCYWACMKFRNS